MDIRSSNSEAELVVLGRDDACNEGSMALAGIKGLNVKLTPPSIPTGYDTSWQTRRLENYSSNPLLRLPNELLLEIMECLPPRDLYLVRQVSHLFAAIFRYAAFSEYHQKNTAEIDPATAEPSVHRLLRAYRKLRGKTAPVPHFIPGVEFNLDALRAKERDSL
ncbi:hypothetical protein K4K57_009694 [Colletotrichum sp. SAR 10_99]|nr:hypothetical protein K4K57_009694 [Colletotrichum sp. SAR 10_99]